MIGVILFLVKQVPWTAIIPLASFVIARSDGPVATSIGIPLPLNLPLKDAFLASPKGRTSHGIHLKKQTQRLQFIIMNTCNDTESRTCR